MKCNISPVLVANKKQHLHNCLQKIRFYVTPIQNWFHIYHNEVAWNAVRITHVWHLCEKKPPVSTLQ